MNLSDCEYGRVYRVHSRNLAFAACAGKGGFVGIREKFGDLYLFKEYHVSKGGTLRVVDLVGDARGLPIAEDLGTVCQTCGKATEFMGPEAGWRCASNCPKAYGVRKPNEQLFAFLRQLEDKQKKVDRVRAWERSEGLIPCPGVELFSNESLDILLNLFIRDEPTR